MRKSFTRLTSVLVLLLLSIQLVMAAPSLKKLSPTDGGILDPTNPVFTMTFKAPVQPGINQIIGLYSNDATQPESKAIQLRAVDKTTDPVSGAITFNHTDGVVVFNGDVVTITWKDVQWKAKSMYWVTVGPSAIWDLTGNFNVLTAFDDGVDDIWEFTVKDLMGPKVTRLTPKDDAKEVPTNKLFGMHLDELVTFSASTYSQMLEDIAVYTSTFGENVVTDQEGGDLVSVYMPNITVFNGNSQVGITNFGTTTISGTVQFDSISIEWKDNLLAHTSQYVRVKPGLFKDLAGNLFAGINNETDWNFDTKDDYFAKPVITDTDGGKLDSDDTFDIDFDNSEVLYLASTAAKISNDQDLKALVTVTNAAGTSLAIKTAKIKTATNTITVVLNSVMVEKQGPFTVCIAAGSLKDASNNLSKGNCETFAAGNWDAPELLDAYVSNQSGTTFDFYIKTNEPAYVHYIVVRKDRKTVPSAGNIFGHSKYYDHKAPLSPLGWYTDVITEGSSNNDIFYRIDDRTDADPDIAANKWPAQNGNHGDFYGVQTGSSAWTLSEIFAEGDIFVPKANFEVLERIVDLPATHGPNANPKAEYEIYYILIDTMDTDAKFAAEYYLSHPSDEHISGVLSVTENVYTTDILMPEAWFDGDTILDNAFTPRINDINKDLPYEGTLEDLRRDGKIYINFNEAIRKENGQEFSSVPATQDAELQACLWVIEGTSTPPAGVNGPDANWQSALGHYGYTASLSADKKQIIIEPDSSWRSEATIWVKIRNSKIEDIHGNEIVPYDGSAAVGEQALYTQDYLVEDYSAPLVRYTYEKITVPMDGMEDIPYQKWVNGTFVTTTIDVTVSDHIFVFPGALIDGKIITNDDPLMKFTNNKADDAYIGKFFKIRKGDGTSVDENSSDPIEHLFTFTIDYTYGDSTKITITPDTLFDSEIWYFIEIDERIQDSNLNTIAMGADVDDNNDRPKQFKLVNALTGNATDPSWIAADPTLDDNKTMVFKSDDSRNPLLTFFSKKQSTLLSDLENLDQLHDVAIDDTIGVYIDEYVSLGFDHFVHFDDLDDEYVLDANAMRRYFKVFDNDSVEMQFDIVDIYTAGLDPAIDSMIFYIDPYYVDANGQPILNSEGKNFKTDSKYTVYFNSIDLDDNGIDERNGKEKGIYWDDNNNLVVVTWAQFYTPVTNATCLTTTITPTPESTNMTPGNMFITIAFEYGVDNSSIPVLQYTEGTSSVFTAAGAWVPGNSNAVRYPVTFVSDSSYTILFGSGFTGAGQLSVNAYPSVLNWPEMDCDKPYTLDSVWHYTMKDATPPELDTFDITGTFNTFAYINVDVATGNVMDITTPLDDEQDISNYDDIVMVFDEDVELTPGKRLTIYDSANRTVATVSAQYCEYAKYKSGGKTLEDKNVIVVPSERFSNKLLYNTHYHIIVDHGFVKDMSGNSFAGILTEDLNAGGVEDGNNDWSFMTGPDPAPEFKKFSPANGTASLSNLYIEFNEAVYPAGLPTDRIVIYEVTAGPTYTEVDGFRSSNTTKITPNSSKTIYTININALEENMEFGKQYAVAIPANSFIDSNGSPLVVSCTTAGVTVDDVLPIDDQTDESVATWYINFRDAISPYVTNTFPYEASMHIAYNSYIYIELNEPIALNDGSAIIPDPNLLNNTIDKFINISRTGNSNVPFDVEFVGNNKRLLRITPLDPLGYGYNPSLDQPTMVPYTDYVVELFNAGGGYFLSDLAGNLMDVADELYLTFMTEDIVEPIILNGTADDSDCKNKVDFHFDVVEASDTVNVYWAILPVAANAPSADDLFNQTVANAVKFGKKAGNTALGVNFTVDMGDFPEHPEFRLYAVVEDLEKDLWAPASSAWDTLFMYDPAKAYGEGYDRIRDIMPAPNQNDSVKQSNVFMIWDNDAPLMVKEYPVRGSDQIPVEANVVFTMSEDIVLNGGLLPDAITLRRYDNNIAVDAVVSWNGADSTITINPVYNLAQETKYYVEIDRYAIEDEVDVCTDNTVFFPQWVGRNYWFETEDNVGPRFVKADPKDGENCVSCPDLNAAGDAIIKLTFNDANPVVVNPKASDKFIYFYRAEEPTANAWAVVAANMVTIAQGSNDTTWVVSVPLTHQYYPNDTINVIVPAGLFADIYGNVYTNTVSAYLETVPNQVDFEYVTCNTEAPAVTWAIHALNGYFNYSEATSVDDGIFGDWIAAAKSGEKGAVVTGVSTHAALKVDFGEEVEFHTSGTGSKPTDWETLSTITDDELMNILSVGSLKWHKSDNTKRDVIVLNKDAVNNTVTLGFIYGKNASKLPIYDLLASAEGISGHIDGGVYSYLDDFYEASLQSETTYAVKVAANKVRATVNCLDDMSPRYVLPEIVTFTTRNDNPPTVDIENVAGESLCETEVCIKKNEILNIHFSDPVVKTSYDVYWLGEESFSYDNLPLNENDLADTDVGKYIEFFKVNRNVASNGTVTYTRTGDPIDVYVVALGDDHMNYQIQAQDDLDSEGWYEIKFNQYTVKKFENNGPNGTVNEDFVCHFFVNDYVNPTLVSKSPSGNNIASDVNKLVITVNEKPAAGAGIMKLRREDGSVFDEFTADKGVIAAVKNSTNWTITFTLNNSLEEFTKYYIEAPKGFITDDNQICDPNPMNAITAKLDPSTGELLSADWWFMTTDATPPQLISINRNGVDLAPNALFPVVGGSVSKNSLLSMRFDENINIDDNENYKGIVIYHDNGQNPDENFGNAVEFIPWSKVKAGSGYDYHKIGLSGSDVYNGLTRDIITIDPEVEFIANGTYYVRVNGYSITDDSGNRWETRKPNGQLDGTGALDQIIDTEWWFTVTNDVEPVLVETIPAYDGVNHSGVYTKVTSTTLDYGYVQTDLTMIFQDANGNDLLVARGDELRMLRVFEYTYDAASAGYISKPWISIPITHDSIEFAGNKVIVHGVILRDGIASKLPSQGLATDSCYYVTVDPGAVLNGYDLSQTWWPGISHGFRWRFTTESDNVFVDGFDIVSPNQIEDGDLGRDLSIEVASELIVKFNEGIEALAAPTGMVKVYDAKTSALVESVIVTPAMCSGLELTVPLTQLYDEAEFYVVVEAGSFGDTSTVSVPNWELGGLDVWSFHTGDNTAPVPVSAVPEDDCVKASPVLVVTYDETINDVRTGVVKNEGKVIIVAADTIAVLTEADIVVEGNTVTIDLMAAGVVLPDTALITVTLSEGLVRDGDLHSPLPSPEYTWSFTTGENTLPFATLSPALVITPDTVITLTFNEPVNVETLEGIVVVNGDSVTVVSVDSLVYTAQLTGLMSETIYEVVLPEGAFMDINAGCTANGNAEATLTFEVDDINPPVAEYYPSLVADYRNVELVIVFDEAVTAKTGYVVIYTEAGEFADSIKVSDFATTDKITYTYTTNDLFFGKYYVLIDEGTFVDATAAPLGVEYAGISTDDVWTIEIKDPSFENCFVIVSPKDGALNVPVNTELVMTFDCEIIKPGAAAIRYVTVAKQDNAGQEFKRFEITQALISADGHKLTVPVTGLDQMTTYSVTIAPGAIEDEGGNQFAGIIDANTWNFTTGDATNPIVTLVADTVNNLDGKAVITSNELGTVYLVHTDVPSNVAAITAAIANGKAKKAAVVAANEAITVSTVGLVEGLYYAVATDAAGNVGVSVNKVLIINIPTVTIAAIQGTGDASPLVGKVVTTVGVVTGKDDNGFFIQDANAVRSGVWVFSPDIAATVGIGSGVKISGTVVEYYGLTEIENVIAIEFVAPVIVPKALVVEANQLGENYEGVLVEVKYLHTIALPDDKGEWMTQSKIDGGDKVKVDEQLFAYTPTMDQSYTIIGVVNYTWNEYKLAPRMLSDITALVSVDPEIALGSNIKVYPNPFNDKITLNVPSEVVLTKAVITNIAGQIVLEVSNPEKTIETVQLRNGVYFISLHTVDGIAKTERIIKR